MTSSQTADDNPVDSPKKLSISQLSIARLDSKAMGGPDASTGVST